MIGILRSAFTVGLDVRLHPRPSLPDVPGAVWVAPRVNLPEAVALSRLLPGRVRFIAYQGRHSPVGVDPVGVRLLDAVVEFDRRAVAERVVEAQRKDFIPCVISGSMSAAQLAELGRKVRSIIVPLRIRTLNSQGMMVREGAIFSIAKPGSVQIHFAPGLAPSDIDVSKMQQARNGLETSMFSNLPGLERHLGRALVASLKSRFFKPVLTDAFQNGKQLKGGMLLAASWLLAERLRGIKTARVGVVLPPGAGATVANLACVLAGKVPVNLNFTAGRQANEAAVRIAGLTHAITAPAVAAKLTDFPWPAEQIDLPAQLQDIGKPAVLIRMVKALFSTAEAIGNELNLSDRGGHAEAGLLFTSGSSGDPKGVPLSHRNILANTAQIDAVLPKSKVPSLLGCLPVFHSFGFTVTLWWPLLGGPHVVTYISPLDTGKILEIIQRYEVALLITTPTFLRSYLKKAKPSQLASLAMVVTGAEKLPPPLLEEFEKRMGVQVCEGYGMTEASPVISVNLPDDFVVAAGGSRLPGREAGTVGRLLPGVDVRVRNPEMEEDMPLQQTGMLWFRGANVFSGYLNDPERNQHVLRDGWYQSGDLGRMTDQGFLVIEGRMSRFSKIGGEMVPHGTVEQHLVEWMMERHNGEPVNMAVVGVQDSRKGECLVVLCEEEINADDARRELLRRGLPNLWIPKIYQRVAEVPTLSSGKLNLRACTELAASTAENSE